MSHISFLELQGNSPKVYYALRGPVEIGPGDLYSRIYVYKTLTTDWTTTIEYIFFLSFES